MAQVSGNQLFYPFEKERRAMGAPAGVKQVRAHAIQLIRDVFKRNVEAKKPNRELFTCCAILRDNPDEHRWFNLAMTVDETVRPEAYGVLEYGGALSMAEALLEGNWYIAPLDLEHERATKDKRDTEVAQKAEVNRKKAEAREMGTEQGRAMAEAMKDLIAPDAKLAQIMAEAEKREKELRAEIERLKAQSKDNGKPEPALASVGGGNEAKKSNQKGN